MTTSQKRYVKRVVDHFVQMYNFDLNEYDKAYRIWFETNAIQEIAIDFLGRLKVPAKLRIRKVKGFPNEKAGIITFGIFHKVEKGGVPLFFMSEEFKKERFLIEIHECCYQNFELFISVFIHELSHLILHSTYNKYAHCEVATDLFVMCSGLHGYVKGRNVPGYISSDEVEFARRYINLKKEHMSSKGVSRVITRIRLHLL